jgi:hypothetical protein
LERSFAVNTELDHTFWTSIVPNTSWLSRLKVAVHDDVIRRDYDAERHTYLESQGIRVLYFQNRALLELMDYVVGVIRTAVLEQ